MNSTALLAAPIGSTILRLAAPNIIAMFVLLITAMAETWYVGQIGIEALAGLALVFPMFMLMNMLAAGAIGGAVAGAVAQALGAGNRDLAESLTLHAVVIALGGGFVFWLIFRIGGGRIFGLLGGDGAVLEQALLYADILFAGGVGIWLANILASVIRACGQMRFSALAMVTASAVQIALGGILVFGLGPFPKLGLAGVALGAVGGFAVSSVVQGVYLLQGRPGIRLRLTGIKLSAAHFTDLLRVGLLASLSPVISVATILVITALVARLGKEALAGYGIGARLEFLLIPIVFGVGAAMITMIGVHFGAGEVDRGHRIAWTGALGAAAITGAIGAVLALFPGLWANLFTDVEAVRQACASYLRITGPFYAFFGLGLCLFFASQGARRLFWPVAITFIRLAVVAAGGVFIVFFLTPSIEAFSTLIAVGMTFYGLAIAVAIRLGAWR